MALQIVTGSSGAGKSHLIYQEMIQNSLLHPEKNYIVIVPEQFTMQTQKDLALMHPNGGLLNIDVLSFNRLAYRVFGEVGGEDRTILEDIGKSLVLQKVIAEQQKNLSVLGGTLRRQGAVEEMKSLVSEMLQYRIHPKDLEMWQTKLSDGSALREKVSDIRTVYQEFEQYLSDRFLTAEGVPEVLCGVIGASEYVRGSEVVFDGFTGFTPSQTEVVRKLLGLCANVTVVITMGEKEDPMRAVGTHRLFYMSHEMTRSLARMAGEEGCEILPVRIVPSGTDSRFAGNEALGFLENHLFRYDSAAFTGKPDTIHLRAAADPGEEARMAAGEILHLVRTERYRFSDFAVVTGDLETYGRELRREFDAAEIPFFLDQKTSVLTNPLVEFVRSAMDMIVRGFSYESVFRFLRCGLTSFAPEETDRMENYVLAVGIRGRKQYEEPWIRIPDSMNPDEMPSLNALREKFCDLTADFTDGMRSRGGTLRHKCAVLWQFMEKNGVRHRIAALQHRFQEDGDLSREDEYGQVYDRLISLMEKMSDVLGSEKMGNALFQQILEAGLQETSIGLIPPGKDQVMVGDIERTRLKHVKVLFFLGVNDGIVPKPSETKGILSETDRDRLKEIHVELAPDAREKMYRQRFYLYLTMTKPSDRLYLSFSQSDLKGESLMPSYLIGVIRKMFPKLEAGSGQTERELLETRNGQREVLLHGFQEIRTERPDAAFMELTQYLAGTPEGGNVIAGMVRAASFRNPGNGIGSSAARELYGSVLSNSATRLEEFASCAFAHFMQYGLRLREREIYEFTPADMGTIMHRALDRFSGSLEKQGLDWRTLTDEQRETLADKAVEDIVHDYGNTILHSSSRNEFLIARIRRMLQRTVWALQEQIRRGDFRPEGSEVAFLADELEALNFRLSEREKLQLRGRIDRLDICDADGKRYVKVIDYKTGTTALDLTALYYGLQVQLMVYLNAAMETEQKKRPDLIVEPAGIFYYNIQDPYIDAVPEEQAAEEFLKKLKMNGLSRREGEVLCHMDRTIAERGFSDVIPVRINKDGRPSKNSSVAGREDFAVLQRFTSHKIHELGMRMLSGETLAAPWYADGKNPCTWCPYKGICGFDERLPGFAYRRLKKHTAEEALGLMKEEI